MPSDKLDEESKSSFSSTVSNIRNQLKNIASTSNHISKVKRAIHALSVYDHEERDPTTLELVSSAMGKLLDSKFDDYSYSRTEQHKIVESKDFSIVAECSLILMPIKLFDITLTRAHVTDKPDTAHSSFSKYKISDKLCHPGHHLKKL